MSKSVPVLDDPAAPLVLHELLQLKKFAAPPKQECTPKYSSYAYEHFDIWLWPSNFKYMVRTTKLICYGFPFETPNQNLFAKKKIAR